jgi:hypothetical protein
MSTASNHIFWIFVSAVARLPPTEFLFFTPSGLFLLAAIICRIFLFTDETHELTIDDTAPHPVGAVAPAPPTAASALDSSTPAPLTEEKPTEAKPAESTLPAPTDAPLVPQTKLAPGMSATSGPLDASEPNFGVDTAEEHVVSQDAAPVEKK